MNRQVHRCDMFYHVIRKDHVESFAKIKLDNIRLDKLQVGRSGWQRNCGSVYSHQAFMGQVRLNNRTR